MSQLAAALGIASDFEFEGRTLKINPRSLEVEAAYELWLESEALAAIQRHAPDAARPNDVVPGRLSAQEHYAMLESWNRSCAAQIFDFTSQAAAYSLTTMAGRKQLAYLTLSSANKGVDRKLVDRLFKDSAALTRFDQLNAGVNRDPLDQKQEPVPDVDSPPTPAPA